ncbi:MAG: hypothetical protein JNK87_15020 [Bryobacterales bacterium]|nr:hypothetical protein [Bryobacterales bacterium]
MLSLLLFTSLLLQAQDPLDIVRKSVDRDQIDFEQAKDYTYVERARFTERDSKGKPKRTESVVSEVMFFYGERYEKRLEKDGKPLSEKDKRKEQERLDKFLADRAEESEKERRKRQQKFEDERRRSREFGREIPEAYHFRLLGEETTEGHQTWVIEALPKPGFKPKVPRAGMLSKFKGRLWISQADYRWVKLEAEAVDTVSWGLFLARLARGSRVVIAQTRVNNEVWMPKSVNIKLDARLALLKRMQGDVEVTYDSFRKFSTESKILNTGELPDEKY